MEIAKRLKINESTVSRLAKRGNIRIDRSGGYHHVKYLLSDVVKALGNSAPNQFNRRFIEEPQTRIYNDFWELPWDEWIMACDAHSPFINDKFFNRMLEVAQKYRIKNFIHGGDFWDASQFSFFDTDPSDMTDFSYDVKYSKQVVAALTETFNDVRFFLGSHDVRFYRMLLRQGKATGLVDIWNLLENKKIKISRYRYANIGRHWRFNHPKNVVRVGGIPGVRMAAKFNRSICFGHGHWFGIVGAPDGLHWLCAPGCLVDRKRIAYASHWDTSHDIWVNGFVMVVEGHKPILFSEDTPWGLYLGGKRN